LAVSASKVYSLDEWFDKLQFKQTSLRSSYSDHYPNHSFFRQRQLHPVQN